MMSKIKRMRINQPSTLQTLHKLHGTNVLVDVSSLDGNGCVTIYFLSGDVISQVAPMTSLSEGWSNRHD